MMDDKYKEDLLRKEIELENNYDINTGEGYYELQKFRKGVIRECEKKENFGFFASQMNLRRVKCFNAEIRSALKDYRQYRETIPEEDIDLDSEDGLFKELFLVYSRCCKKSFLNKIIEEENRELEKIENAMHEINNKNDLRKSEDNRLIEKLKAEGKFIE